MKNIIFLICAYGFIWLIIAYYFFVSGRKINKLEERLSRIIDEKDEKL